MQQKLGLMKQSMGSENSEKSGQIKWKEIVIVSLISVVIGLFLIHYEIFVTNNEPSSNEQTNNQVVQVDDELQSSEGESWYKLGGALCTTGTIALEFRGFFAGLPNSSDG